MEFKPLQLLLFALIGGTLLGISFPFTGGIFPLVFVAFVPLIFLNLSLNLTQKRRFFKRFGYNYLYFLVFNTITTWWIYNASEGGMYMAILANSVLMVLPFLFFGFIARFLGENKGILSLVVMWLSLEFCHYLWELSWPWLSFGHVFGEYPILIQWYEYTGVTGGTLWVLFINVLVYFILRNVYIKKESLRIQAPFLLFLVLSLTIPVISSVIIYFNYEEKEDPINMVIVQPNINAYTEKFSMPLPDQLELIFNAADKKITAETDLILCPETAISRPVNEDYLDQEPAVLAIKDFLRAHNNVKMLIGADAYRYFDEEKTLASNFDDYSGKWLENYNSAFLIDPNRPVQVYHKAKPVLGAEKVPFLSWFPSLKKYSVELGGTSGMIGLGESPKVFEVGDFRYAPLICYESVYGDYTTYFTALGADVICIITNDGWWGDTPGYKQHRMFARIRAIENRRTVARSANTGISCFIDQRGDVIQELGWDKRGALAATVNKSTVITFFTKYGDVTGRISLFLAIAMFIYACTNFAKTTGLADKAKLIRK